MNETAEKTETRAARIEQIRGAMRTASVKFRSGEDSEGIDSLLFAVSALESFVEDDQASRRPEIDLKRLLPAVRTLCFLIWNRDIAGIADLLEDTLYPMTGEWTKGCRCP